MVYGQMVKNAIKREQSRTCSSYAEREHFRRSQWSTVNGQWNNALFRRVRDGPSTHLDNVVYSCSKLFPIKANGQWSTVNGQWSMVNGNKAKSY